MIIRADARQIPLVDGCVQTVVTSPPYWGLRDYGTARWEGGDPACEHVGSVMRTAAAGTEKQASNMGSVSVSVSSGNCLCGAERVDAQIGLEQTPEQYVAVIVAVFEEVRRVLKDDGTCWINLGDSYGSGTAAMRPASKNGAVGGWSGRGNEINRNGLKAKDLVGIPWRVAFALQAAGWYLRSDIIWAKPNPMPESVTDRPTKAHEYLFLLAKNERYYYDAAAIAEPASYSMVEEVEQGYSGLGIKDYEAAGVQNPSSVKARIIAGARKRSGSYQKDSGRNDGGTHLSGGFPTLLTRNKRTVWTVNTMPYAGAHFATMPERLVEPCILAGAPLGGLVFDPFLGSGTVGAVAERLGRRWVGTDLSYQPLSTERTAQRGIRFE